MKILIVDNNTKHIEDVKALCVSNEIHVMKWGEISPDTYTGFDLIILSGGSGMAIDKHEEDFLNEIELIKNSNRPIIGICLGFELICHTFGCKMEREEEREKGIVKIDVVKNDVIFEGKDKLNVMMMHKWHVRDVDSILEVLARSEKGIDIVKHFHKPIYGFQFHPEIIEPQNDGSKIFMNCLNNISK